MRRYLYYPGCSLEGTAAEYDIATRSLMAALGAELVELENWTCCGATAAPAVSTLLATALAARNLALAEHMDSGGDLLVPCSGCYLNLKNADARLRRDPAELSRINAVLAEEQLHISSSVTVRHLLDVLSLDFDVDQIAERVTHPLMGLKVAPYYGCQCIRPYVLFDDPEMPRSMEPLLRAAGADLVAWHMGAKCCGASHMSTKMEVGVALSGAILDAAQGADVIVTVCPMCQMNLEAYQRRIARATGRAIHISVVYLPQLLGIAIRLDKEKVRLDLNLSVTKPVKQLLGAMG